jgi:hypothetical protein
MGDYGIYKKLLEDAELRNATPELSDFFQSKENSNMGNLHHAMADFNRLRHTEISGIYSATSQEHAISLQSIVPENRAEQTLSEVMRILYANVEAIGSMNTAQKTQLREIALRCPLDDGFGVYIARAALLKLDTLPRNYLSECEKVPSPEETGWKSERTQTTEVNGFAVYPNPNNGEMILEYHLNETETGQITIYNSLGQTVFSQNLNTSATKMTIQLNGISSGLYSVSVIKNAQLVLSEKVSILE